MYQTEAEWDVARRSWQNRTATLFQMEQRPSTFNTKMLISRYAKKLQEARKLPQRPERDQTHGGPSQQSGLSKSVALDKVKKSFQSSITSRFDKALNEKLRQDSIKKTPKVVVQKRFKDEQLLGVTNYTDYSIIQSMYTPKLQAVGEALVNKCQDNESKLLRPDSQLSVQRTKHGHRTCKISSHINPENHAHADISSLTNLFPEGKPTATQ